MSTADSRSLPLASELVERGIAAARPDDAVVIVRDSFDADVRFANNTTTTNGMRRDRSVAVAVIVDRPGGPAVGVVSGSGSVEITDLVERARAQAASGDPAPDAAPLVECSAVDADFFEGPRPTDLGRFAPMLDGLRDAFGEARARHQVLAGFATHESATTYLGTSRGLRHRHVQPTGSFELVARTEDGVSSAWVAQGTEDFSDVAVSKAYGHLATRLEHSRRKVELPAGRYEVILPPDAVADLVIELLGAMSGRDAEDGGNVFSAPSGTRLDERVTELAFVLSSDPRDPLMTCDDRLVTTSSGSDVSVFDNGAPLERIEWIADGILRRLRYHRAGAQRSGRPFAAPIDNLALDLPGADKDLDDLIAGTSRGLLLTCLWYIREVDPATLLLTGLTRDGVYLVEDGEITGAVNNFRFNESPLDMLNRVREAGRSTRALSREWGEWMNRTKMPPLRIAEFNMSSVSQAN